MVWQSFDKLISKIKHLNSNPVLWRSKRFQYVKFGMWAAIGTFISAFSIFFYLTAKGYRLNENVAAYFLLGGFMVWFFSRLGHILSLGKKFFQNPKKYLLETGLYNQGGLVAGMAIAWIAVKKMQLPWNVALDAMAVGASIGLVFGRIGCYAYGCCWGKETEKNYGVKYHHPGTSVIRSKPHLIGKNLYPTQLMTAFVNLLIFIIAMGLLYIDAPQGMIFLMFIIVHEGARLWLELYRDDMNFDEGRNYSTVYVALTIFSIGLILLLLHFFNVFSFLTPSIIKPRNDLPLSLIDTLSNVNIWLGAFTITAVMGFLLGIHGKELGKW